MLGDNSNNGTSALSYAGSGTCLTALDVAVSGGQVQGCGRVLVDVRSRLNQSLAHTVVATHLQCVVVCEQWLEEVTTHSHQRLSLSGRAAYCSKVERC
jgi:hypothetical protein